MRFLKIILFTMLLIIISFWPLAIFWEAVTFSPDRFTEEWIKLTSTGLLLYILLRVFEERRSRFSARENWSHLLSTKLLNPLVETKSILDALITSKSPTINQRTLDTMLDSWLRFKTNLEQLLSHPSANAAWSARTSRLQEITTPKATLVNQDLVAIYGHATMGRSLDHARLQSTSLVISTLTIDIQQMGKPHDASATGQP